jgi:hypothetical protein
MYKSIYGVVENECGGNTDQRGFNDTSEDFTLFESRVLSFEGRDGPAIRGCISSIAKAVQDTERQENKC